MSQPRFSGITVIGTGRASAPSDQVLLTLRVEVLRPDAGEAFTVASETTSNVLAVLSDNGIDARSVRTAELSLGPRTDFRDGREILLGYVAAQRLQARVETLGQLPRLLTDVVHRGGNGIRIENVQLQAADPVAARRRARDAAFADATAIAEQYAALAGRSLGQLRNLDETMGAPGQPQPMLAAKAMTAAADMPIATGDEQVEVKVLAHWDFAEAAE
ncbi:SIMPL domain-containing protein [Nakamurella aerolata]|uniref:SIMPL domain-containing protein n=1 Tax=Nakamurella aerolata TaxID=1656892 RepID=A0A849A886_9ACTN|nr:SIMPL domain-containing protein [Nakamurella aerolata]NNG36769.1 SIMPL domain-containing protein [Nakamurella aerolata]